MFVSHRLTQTSQRVENPSFTTGQGRQSDIDRAGRILIVACLLTRHLTRRHIRGRAVGMAAVVKEPPTGELVKAVIVPVVVVLVRHLVVVVPQLVRVDGIKVGGVRVIEDARLVRGLPTPQRAAEVNILEEALKQTKYIIPIRPTSQTCFCY